MEGRRLKVEDGKFSAGLSCRAWKYTLTLIARSGLGVISTGDFVADFLALEDLNKNPSPYKTKARIGVNQNQGNFEKIYAAQNNSIIPEEQHALDAKFTKVRNYTIGGYRAIDYTYEVPGNQTEKSYTIGTIINKNGVLISIFSMTSSDVYNQILSTFRFLP